MFKITEDNEVLIVTTGTFAGSHYGFSHTDIFYLENGDRVKCSNNLDSPIGLYSATGGAIYGENKDILPIICGGYDDETFGLGSSRCFKLGMNDSGLEPFAAMKYDRVGASSVVIDNGATLWVTGGGVKYGRLINQHQL